MKHVLWSLPLVCVAPLATADSVGPEPSSAPAVEAREAAPAAAPYRMANHRIKRLPSGDIRHCLDLKTNDEIIRCAETRRRK